MQIQRGQGKSDLQAGVFVVSLLAATSMLRKQRNGGRTKRSAATLHRWQRPIQHGGTLIIMVAPRSGRADVNPAGTGEIRSSGEGICGLSVGSHVNATRHCHYRPRRRSRIHEAHHV
jgi:hypothetical protein